MSDGRANNGGHPNSVANIIKANEDGSSAATRFGGERANPTAGELGINTGSYRAAARYLSKQPMIRDEAGKLTLAGLPDQPTPAQYVMHNVIAKAAKADMTAVQYLTEQVDGKVAQINLNAEAAAIDGMSDDEIKRELASLRGYAQGIDAPAPAEDEGHESPAIGG